MSKSSTQRDRILAILFGDVTGLTRNEINRITRQERKEIPVQTLCRRLSELMDMGYVISINRRECPVTKSDNAVYRLSAAMRAQMSRVAA